MAISSTHTTPQSDHMKFRAKMANGLYLYGHITFNNDYLVLFLEFRPKIMNAKNFLQGVFHNFVTTGYFWWGHNL